AASIRNYQLGVFAQDRVTLSRRIQFEAGIRADRESVAPGMNMGPRLAASFLPFGNDRSKITAGFGFLYDNIPLQNVEMARMERRLTTSVDANGNLAPVAAPTTMSVASDLRDPYSVHLNVSWENEWAPRWVSRINFIEKRGKHQTRLEAIPST